MFYRQDFQIAIFLFFTLAIFIMTFDNLYSFIDSIPIFISLYLFGMAIYHSFMHIIVSEINNISTSKIWYKLKYANYVGIALTVFTALLCKSIYSFIPSGYIILIFALSFDIITHFFANITAYSLIKPVTKRSIKIYKLKYLISLPIFIFYIFLISDLLFLIIFPIIEELILILIYIIFFLAIILYLIISTYLISKDYSKVGFVHKPFQSISIGLVFYLGFLVFLIYALFHLEIIQLQKLYYKILFFVASGLFTLEYYLQFVIEYPSILQPKWRALMPFDIFKITYTGTLAFIAVSLFFSVKDTAFFEAYTNISYHWYGVTIVLILLILVVFLYNQTIAKKTRLKYWNYLKNALFIYTGASFYILAIAIFSWNNSSETLRFIIAIFILILFAFYAFYMLDLRYIAKNLNVKMKFDPLVSLRYLLSYISVFFIILFGIGFIHGEALPWPGALALEKHPLIIGFILVFLISYVSYLSTTHRGFEEFMKKNVWSNLSYLSGFFAFVTVFFFYRSLPAVDEFPLHGAFFLAYFGVLLIEIYAINTLKVKPSPPRMGTIVEHLNRLAGSWIRTDILRDILEDIKQRYASKNPEVEDIQLDEENRAFNFPEIGRNLRNSISVAILLEMYSSDNKDRFSLSSKGLEDILLDIEEILGPKILTLPPDLRQNFDTSRHYPLVLKNTLETISEKFSTFIPESEHLEVITKLARINSFFSALVQEGELPPMGKEEFRKALSIYLETLEESFPFEYSLFRTAMMKTITEELSSYGVRGEEALNIAPTGITRFDEVTGGGIPQNSSTVLQSEETRGKRVFLHNFLLEGLKKGDSVIYLSSGVSYSEVEDYILKELSPEHLRHLTFLDLYSAINEKKGIKNIEEEGNRLLVPPDLTLIQHAIVKTIKSLPREEHKRVIIDAFTDLAFHYKWEELEEIVGKQIEGYRRWNCTSMVALNPEVVPPKELEDVKKHFNNSLVLKTVGREGKLTLEKLHGGLPRERMVIFHY